jgi:hypothetical protein
MEPAGFGQRSGQKPFIHPRFAAGRLNIAIRRTPRKYEITHAGAEFHGASPRARRLHDIMANFGIIRCIFVPPRQHIPISPMWNGIRRFPDGCTMIIMHQTAIDDLDRENSGCVPSIRNGTAGVKAEFK